MVLITYASQRTRSPNANFLFEIPQAPIAFNVSNEEDSISKQSLTFFDQDEFIIVPQFFSSEFVKQFFVPEANQLHTHVHRSYIPFQKQGGSVSSYVIAKEAPMIQSLYHNRQFIEYLKKITKESKFFECPVEDPHGVALYYYEQPGDHISWHYDTSFYKGNIDIVHIKNFNTFC